MAKNIILYIADPGAEQASWLICDDHGSPVSAARRDTLENVASQVEGRKVTVVVPAEWVTLTSATVPGSTSRAIKAIPFSLEDSLSEDVEDVHIAIGDRLAGDTYPVAIISHERMQTLRERFHAVGLRPMELRPEPLALPRFKDSANGWTGFIDDKRLVLRLDDFNGYAVEVENADLLIEHSIKDAGDDKPAGLVLFRQTDDALHFGNDALNIEERHCEDEITLFARGVYNSPGINLLQGDYSFKQQFDRAWKPWRPAMAMAVMLGLVFGVGKFIEYQKQSSRVVGQKAEMAKILQRTFPSIKRVVDPRKQMQTELKKLGAGGLDNGFVAAINGISSALGEAGNTNLNAISYKTGRMDLDLDTDQLGTLDKLKQTLESDGKYSMTIESANQSSGRIRGRIRVEVRG